MALIGMNGGSWNGLDGPPGPGLGTFIARCLVKVGIKKTGCGGCGRRETKLNQFGWWLMELLRKITFRRLKRPKTTKAQRRAALLANPYQSTPEKDARRIALSSRKTALDE